MKPYSTIVSLAALALAAAALLPSARAQAQNGTLTTLHAFTGDPDGSLPSGALVKGSDGNFYGTTFAGGGPGKIGTVFKMTPAGTVTTLYSFTGGADGSFVQAGLVLSSDGNFYGTTSQGITDAIGGTVFRITPTGTLTTLYKFPGGAGGQFVYAGLVQGSTDGLLYGTTVIGGGAGIGFGAGTVFTIDPAGTPPVTPTFLHSFSGGADGGSVYGGVVEGTDGNFYGTTYGGGMVNSLFPNGAGTVFKITPTGTLTTLHTFTGGADGSNPQSGLVLASDGDFYGTTTLGNRSSLTPNGGTVFKITSTGTFTTLHTFTLPEGSLPIAPLIQGADGNFYGTAEAGGETDGTVFEITPAGTLTVLYTFTGMDGREPQSALFQDSDGSFYGTTAFGGSANDKGQVFRLDVALTPTPARLQNISTRLQVLTDDKVLIGGFIITGAGPKNVIVRAIGPSLPLAGLLADPVLELHESDGTVITNDNWKDTQEAAIVATTLQPGNDLESAIVATLDPGAYTAIVSGKNGGTGIALVEAYDLDQTGDSQLANISTRGFVDTGDNVMIGGFIAGPDTSTSSSVLVRAIGPSLPLSDDLPDPTLELHDGNGAIIATNDNWKIGADGMSQQAEIEATNLAPTNDLESAILATVAPGGYTAIVRGANNATGIALVEVYNLQ